MRLGLYQYKPAGLNRDMVIMGGPKVCLGPSPFGPFVGRLVDWLVVVPPFCLFLSTRMCLSVHRCLVRLRVD